jgi:glycosyltransferase involved in cell wall biosynthesis
MIEFELVLPCYNESLSLKTLIDRAIDAAEQAGFTSDRFQLVLVENGSKDESSQVMEELKTGERGKWFRKVQVEQNQGYGHGVWAGLTSTTAPYVAWSHADQQCDPKDAFVGLARLKSSSHPRTLVKGTRRGRNWKDKLVSRVFELFARVLLGIKINELNAQPKVFPSDLFKEIQNPPKTFAFDLYVLYRAARAGYRVETIPVLFPPRIHGVSNWAANFAGRRRTIMGMIQYMWQLSQSEGRA